MAIHKKLGPALREDSYHRSLENHLAEKNLEFLSQPLYSVYDDPQQTRLIGYYIPDFIVDDRVVVEIKALNELDNTHLAQIIGYLAVTHCPIGLLINFSARRLQYRRIFPPKKIIEHPINSKWLIEPDELRSRSRKLLHLARRQYSIYNSLITHIFAQYNFPSLVPLPHPLSLFPIRCPSS
jgi:GxxExxY protein